MKSPLYINSYTDKRFNHLSMAFTEEASRLRANAIKLLIQIRTDFKKIESDNCKLASTFDSELTNKSQPNPDGLKKIEEIEVEISEIGERLGVIVELTTAAVSASAIYSANCTANFMRIADYSDNIKAAVVRIKSREDPDRKEKSNPESKDLTKFEDIQRLIYDIKSLIEYLIQFIFG